MTRYSPTRTRQSCFVPASLRLPTGRGSFARLRNASATRNRTSSWSFLRSFSAERSTTTRYIASPSAFVDRQARLPMDGNEVFCVARVSARQHLRHPQGAPAFVDLSLSEESPIRAGHC